MMTNEYLHWIVSNNRFSNAYEKLIYFELADRTDENGKCSPSLAKLSRASMLSKQTVIKTLRALEVAGKLIWFCGFGLFAIGFYSAFWSKVPGGTCQPHLSHFSHN